jgi:chorismate-pyruvate lyase
MQRICSRVFSAALLACAGAQAQPRPQLTPAWPDSYLARVQALALLQTLDAEILASDSATLSLEAWCRDHRLADDPRIVARVLPVAAIPASGEQRLHLQAGRDERVNYRKVQLRCGGRVLSEADNWYVPARLTTDMNRLLETTDTPFGKVVRPLRPYRRTFAVRLLWSPLPDGWENSAHAPASVAAGALALPAALFEHRALLYTAANQPFAEVHEVYQRDVLAFTPPAP